MENQKKTFSLLFFGSMFNEKLLYFFFAQGVVGVELLNLINRKKKAKMPRELIVRGGKFYDF